MSKIGVFGGAFNPPHLGHMILAQEAQHQLGLERVLFVPTGRAPHKQITDDPGARERLAMVEAMVDGVEGWEASGLEVERAEVGSDPTFMVETLEALASAGKDGERLVLILGADSAAGVGEWHRPTDLTAFADFAIAARPGTDVGDARAALEAIGARSVDLVTMPLMEISSTDIRERIRTGRPVRFMLPEAVRLQVAEAGSYR